MFQVSTFYRNTSLAVQCSQPSHALKIQIIPFWPFKIFCQFYKFEDLYSPQFIYFTRFCVASLEPKFTADILNNPHRSQITVTDSAALNISLRTLSCHKSVTLTEAEYCLMLVSVSVNDVTIQMPVFCVFSWHWVLSVNDRLCEV